MHVCVLVFDVLGNTITHFLAKSEGKLSFA